MEYFDNENFYNIIYKDFQDINNNIIHKINCYDNNDNNDNFLNLIKNQIIFILNDNLNNFVRNTLGESIQIYSFEIISSAIPQSLINFSISKIKQLYTFATKNRKYLLDNKIKYSLNHITDDIKNIEEYNKYFIEIYIFYYKYIKFIILNKEKYNEILTIKNLINNKDIKYNSSYNYLEKLYNNILKSNYNNISNNMIKYIIENINIEFNIFNIYNIDIILNSHIKNLNCINKDEIDIDNMINHTFIINILYGLYDYISYNHIKVDANFITKTFVYILNKKNEKYFYLFYLSLLNDITYKLKNFKLIDFKENIINNSNNDLKKSNSDKKEFITVLDNNKNIDKLSNIINNDIKNILNNLYNFIGSIVLIENTFWYVYNIEINKDKQYYFNIFTLNKNNKIEKKIMNVNLEYYLFYKYDEYKDFNILINIMILYLIDHDNSDIINNIIIKECSKNNFNNDKNKNDEYMTEKIFLCVIYHIYLIIYNNIIDNIYNINSIPKPFIGKECCECKREKQNTMYNKPVIELINNKCFLHNFKKIDIENIFPKDNKNK